MSGLVYDKCNGRFITSELPSFLNLMLVSARPRSASNYSRDPLPSHVCMSRTTARRPPQARYARRGRRCRCPSTHACILRLKAQLSLIRVQIRSKDDYFDGSLRFMFASATAAWLSAFLNFSPHGIWRPQNPTTLDRLYVIEPILVKSSKIVKTNIQNSLT